MWSCSDDEVALALVTFSRDSSTVAESKPQALIVLELDKVATGDITVSYVIEGSATQGEDYTAPGTVTLTKGSVDVIIAIDILDDTTFEFDPEIVNFFAEKVKITLTGITGAGRLPDNVNELSHTLIIFEDDPIEHSMTIELTWDAGNGTAGDVDMDLLLFLIDPEKGPLLVGASQQVGTAYEGIVVGTPAPDAAYGLAYRYFEGSSDNLSFKVKFIAESGNLPGDVQEMEFSGTYSQANVNGDVSAGASVKIAQFFQKDGSAYSGFSEIEIPSSGSRAQGQTGRVNKFESVSNIY